ncbi:MAG TPA: hypothetical protein VKG79_11545 [Bryobacteraceae bacterium]|nr:hypothetical protein [Bryobacteraceae bacterium]
MRNILLALLLSTCLLAGPGAVKKKDKAEKSGEEITSNAVTLLWREPTDIVYRDLYFGPGGEAHRPHGPFTFIKEDMDGTNPKFSVRDRDGMKWKVKLGTEAKPETVATRLVWAVGYFTNEDYFLPEFRVDDMPRLRRRGANHFIEPDGSMRNVRLKREPDDEKKIGIWRWRDDPFYSTREWNGLRVMMALINNWDLEDKNNSIYELKHRDQPEQIYMVSDLGASFGTAWLDRTHQKSKGNLESYQHSKFIRRVRADSVDFEDPRRPALIVLFDLPEFLTRLGIRWIGRDVPRDDAKWMGGFLSKLSDGQIRDAFRAAGYSPEEIEGFTAVVENRIAQLNQL